jgi:hypothetical protein
MQARCSVCNGIIPQSPFLGPGCFDCRKGHPVTTPLVVTRSSLASKGIHVPGIQVKCQQPGCGRDAEPLYSCNGKPFLDAWDLQQTRAGCCEDHDVPLCPICQQKCPTIGVMFGKSTFARCCSPEHDAARSDSDFPECLYPGCKAEQECITQGWFKGWCTFHAYTQPDSVK